MIEKVLIDYDSFMGFVTIWWWEMWGWEVDVIVPLLEVNEWNNRMQKSSKCWVFFVK